MNLIVGKTIRPRTDTLSNFFDDPNSLFSPRLDLTYSPRPRILKRMWEKGYPEESEQGRAHECHWAYDAQGCWHGSTLPAIYTCT
jgi:hypothetical protein